MTRASRKTWRWIAILVPLATGCGVVIGLEEPSFDGAKADGGDAALGDAASGDGASCTADLTTSADHCGRCGRSCLGKACRDAICGAQLLADGYGSIQDVALDDDSVYFNSGSQWLLGRVGKDGGDVTVLLPEGGLKEPTAGLQADGAYVYASAYTSGSGFGARRVPKNGGPQEQIDGCNTGWSVAVDATDVYWLTGDCGKRPRMRRRAKDEPDAAATVESIIDDAGAYAYARFGYTALDETDVYWVNKHQIKGLTKSGIQGGLPRTVYDAPSDTIDLFRAFAVADRFYAVFGNRVISIPKTGGEATVLVDGTPSKSEARAGILVADGYVYFTLPELGIVARIRANGGAMEPLAKSQQKPTGIAVDAKYVYWSNAGDGTIWRVAR